VVVLTVAAVVKNEIEDLWVPFPVHTPVYEIDESLGPDKSTYSMTTLEVTCCYKVRNIVWDQESICYLQVQIKLPTKK